MNPQFWQHKKVLLTGHTGFKGSWLTLWLQQLGAKVTGYSLPPPTQPSLFELTKVATSIDSINGDIRDFEHLRSVMAECQPEIVIHLAATNVMGTVNVLEAVRLTNGVKVVIIVTSDKCYDNKEWIWAYRENEPMGGYDPYSNSKGCAELVTAAYRNSYFNPSHYDSHGVAVASTRAGNVIGGGDWAKDRLIPDILQAFLTQRPVIIRHPNAIRPWQHVLEPLHGYLLLAEHLWEQGPAFAEGWNFGPPESEVKPVSWIVEQLAHLWGEPTRWECETSPQPHEANYLKLDCSKAQSRLHWRPQLSLENSLEWIVEWYRGFRDRANLRTLTELQINRYQPQVTV
jgi:CDP-glucose 4,6-dehydratase